MDNGIGQLGKWLIVLGLALVIAGGLVILLGRLGLFRLPGDLQFGSDNWRVYVPITTSIVLSAVLTLILWLMHMFRR